MDRAHTHDGLLGLNAQDRLQVAGTGNGKTRALEVTECLVPRPVHSVNNSVAYVIRKVADDSGRPTILYDEVDALFRNKQPDKADLLALLNAGHRKGATSGRCIVDGGKVRLEELPAYSALALAGLRSLPDTIASRSILIEMRRRAPDETIEPFRDRIHRAQARPIYDELELWCAYTARMRAIARTGWGWRGGAGLRKHERPGGRASSIAGKAAARTGGGRFSYPGPDFSKKYTGERTWLI